MASSSRSAPPSGQPHFDPAILARRAIQVFSGGTPQYVTAANVEQAVEELYAAMRAGLFDDLAIVRYPLARAAQVHEDIAGRRLEGIAVLMP
ncbi:hypothetical protein ACLB1G_04660 [Oxalobacteraceae bacterium A2-2]